MENCEVRPRFITSCIKNGTHFHRAVLVVVMITQIVSEVLLMQHVQILLCSKSSIPPLKCLFKRRNGGSPVL